MTISETIRLRRTSKDYDGREVPESLLSEALDLANLAPNHKLNQPWRFRVLNRSKVQDFISHLKSQLNSEDLKLFEKPLERLSKVGALIYIGCVKDQNDFADRENYAATCAAIQNILLFATDKGLSSYWSSAKIFGLEVSKSYIGFPENEWLVGAIWLGYGKNPEAPKRKPASELTTWI